LAVDRWPQEEGYIVEGNPVMMCVSGGTITENASVMLSATTAGQVTVTHGANWGDAIGVALRAVTVTGDMVPVAFGGIVKMLNDGTIALGETVCNLGDDTSKVIDTASSANMMLGDNGTAYVLGIALHAGVTDGDEILVMLGRH